MFALGGVTVTWGVLVLAFGIVGLVAWITRYRPYVVAVLVTLIAAVHAVAYGTAYLDATRVASARSTATELLVTAFLAVAGALDVGFAAIGDAIAWFLAGLADVPMPQTSVSVLEFGSFLLLVAALSAFVCGALLRIPRWAEGAPLGGWLAALGVVFGAIGIGWTLLPITADELTTLHALLIVAVIAAGVIVAVAIVRGPVTPKLRKRVRVYR